MKMIKTGISRDVCSERIRKTRGNCRNFYYKYNRYVDATESSFAFEG